MLDLFSCKRKSGDGLVRYFQVMPNADLPARAAVPDSVGRGSARYIGGVLTWGPATGPEGIPRNLLSTPFPCLVRMHR